MHRSGLERDVVDQSVYERAVRRFSEAGVVLPTFAELVDPERLPPAAVAGLAGVGPDAARPRGRARVPA